MAATAAHYASYRPELDEISKDALTPPDSPHRRTRSMTRPTPQTTLMRTPLQAMCGGCLLQGEQDEHHRRGDQAHDGQGVLPGVGGQPAGDPAYPDRQAAGGQVHRLTQAHLLLIEKWESLEHDQAYRDWRATAAGASALSTIVASRSLTRFVAA